MIRAASPFIVALFVASCSLFAPPAPPSATQRAKLRELAACVADKQCATRACFEAALLSCSAASIEQGGAGGEAGH